MASASASASASTSTTSHAQPATNHGPITATGDWTKSLVHLAKTAELRKHALTLQMHTAHILSAHTSLDQKKKAMEDVKEQRNKLDSERTRLLIALQAVNADRDQADMLELTLNKDCADLQTKIQTLTDGEYAHAKVEVDKLRQELGQSPLPSLQATIEEKTAQYLNEMRMAGEKRGATVLAVADAQPAKRRRGRPPGSKTTKGKNAAAGASAPADTPGPETASTTSAPT